MNAFLTEEMKQKILNDSDFIALKRFDYSLKKLMKRYPDGVPNDRIIAQAMMLSESELAEVFETIVEKLKKGFGTSI